MGESPGIRNRCPERRNQTPLAQYAPAGVWDPLQRQHVPDDSVEPLLEDPREPRALLFVLQLGLQRVDVHRQPPFPPEIVPDVFVRGMACCGSTPSRSASVSEKRLACASSCP
jgi:hypothetical protein